jgi:hypothetical protein
LIVALFSVSLSCVVGNCIRGYNNFHYYQECC